MPNIELLNCDCMEYMASLPDRSIDMVFTSPPYNLGDMHHTGNIRHKVYEDNMPEKDYQDWQIAVLKQCYRVLKDEGSIIYNHKNRIKNGIQITPYEWILKTPLIVKQEIVWFNRSQNFDNIRFYPMTERIYWLAKSSKTKLFNVLNHHDFFDTKDWESVGTKGEHKRAFPKKMVTDILKCFPQYKLVLDPFSGSGTTAIAAYDCGIDFIGCELDIDYYNDSKERFEAHVAKYAPAEEIGVDKTGQIKFF